MSLFTPDCYGCGRPFSPETLALMARIEEEGETPRLVEELNASSLEHESCFA